MPIQTSFDVELSQCLSSLLTELSYELNDKGKFPEDVYHLVQGAHFHELINQFILGVIHQYLVSRKEMGFVDLLCHHLKESIVLEWK